MTDLGELGKARPVEEPLTFGYFGHALRTHPDLTDVRIMRLIGRLQQIKGGIAAVQAFEDVSRALIHPEDVDTFWDLAESNRQTVDDIGDAIEQIMEGVTDRPTQRPTDSSPGPQTTPASSGGDSSSRVIDRYVTEGRTDLALGVLRSVG